MGTASNTSCSRRNDILFLLAITALGCILRFICLDRPALWNDEALAFGRTCGTYDQLLEWIRDDGFGPLHYEVLWTLAQRFHMTPFMIRVWPAVTGTLMVPAMYMLAYQLLGRRTARAVAVLSACSAFLLAYSRDGKMYMPLWFFITLNVGSLLWWMKSGRTTAWLLAVAAGCAAAGLHVTGLVVLGLDLLIAFTGPNLTWRKSLALIVALVLIGSGPVGYALGFNQMNDRIDRYGWGATGIDWVSGRTDGHDGAALAADSAGGMLFTFMWLDEQKVHVHVPPKIMAAAAGLLAFFTAAAVLGVVIWRRNSTPFTLQQYRAALWLGFWILVPAYAFYRVTLPFPDTWQDWYHQLCRSAIDQHRYVWILLGLIFSIVLAAFRPTRIILAILAAVLLIWPIAVVVSRAVLADTYSTVVPPNWLWVHPLAPWLAAVSVLVISSVTSPEPLPRKILIAFGIVAMIGTLITLFEITDTILAKVDVHPIWILRYLGFIYPAVLISVTALLLRLPFAALRWAVFAIFIAVNLTQAFGHAFISTEPRIDLTAADVMTAIDSNGQTLAFTPDASPSFGPNTAGSIVDFVGSYYLFELSRKPITPQEFRDYRNVQNCFPLRLESDAGSIKQALSSEPKAQRIIVWDGLETDQAIPPEDVLPRIGKQWHRESQELYPVRNFWDWGELYTYRRRVYTK